MGEGLHVGSALLASAAAEQTCDSAGLYAMGYCNTFEQGSEQMSFKMMCDDDKMAYAQEYSGLSCATGSEQNKTMVEGVTATCDPSYRNRGGVYETI